MKTTLNISPMLMRQLKQEAARRECTMTELVESALRLFLQRRNGNKKLSPLPTFNGGRLLVDVADRKALYDAMEREIGIHG